MWVPAPKSVEFADLVAFGQTVPKNMTTALVVVSLNGLDTAHRVARALGAPFIIRPRRVGFDLRIAKHDRLEQWRVVDDHEVEDVRPFLRPEAASLVKVGLRQLPLFDTPVDFLEPARTGSSESLSQIVGEALSATSTALHTNGSETERRTRGSRSEAARLVVGALTALVARDVSPTAPTADPRGGRDADAVVEEAVDKYPQTFQWWHHASKRERSVLAGLIEQLGLGINYRSLDPSVLCRVYEQALVDTDTRRALGIHYTPPSLATRILASLPVEFIDPAERHVLDPACGSGALLIAAHERLFGLQSLDWSLDERHEDLQRCIRGFDKDGFAAEVARLALLLRSQPAGNGWTVEARDALTVKELQPRPRIIVMNPPWGLERAGKLHQRADKFMEWAADNLTPGGLLGTIIPTSWLSARNSTATRERICSDFEVFEIWRLPQDTFTTSRQSPAVMLARKHEDARRIGSRVVRHIWRHERDKFLAGDPPLTNVVVGNTSVPLSAAMPPLEYSASTCPLQEIATVISGQQPRSGAIDERTERYDQRRVPSGSWIAYLPRFKDVRPYSLIVQSDELPYVDFPEDFQSSRGYSIIDKRKILVPAAGDPGNPWRFKVVLDTVGIGCSNSMRGVAPKDQSDDDLLYALLAILGSGFASAYATGFGIDRNIPADVLKTLPVPTVREAIEYLGSLGRAATEYADEQGRLRHVLAEIEQAVWMIYDVDYDFREKSTRLLAGHEAPDGSIRYEAQVPDRSRSKSMMRRLGAVHQVAGSTIDIWINGVTTSHGITTEVPPRMPGWLLRPGATFDARNIESVDDIAPATFEFQPMSWQTYGFDDPTDSLTEL